MEKTDAKQFSDKKSVEGSKEITLRHYEMSVTHSSSGILITSLSGDNKKKTTIFWYNLKSVELARKSAESEFTRKQRTYFKMKTKEIVGVCFEEAVFPVGLLQVLNVEPFYMDTFTAEFLRRPDASDLVKQVHAAQKGFGELREIPDFVRLSKLVQNMISSTNPTVRLRCGQVCDFESHSQDQTMSDVMWGIMAHFLRVLFMQKLYQLFEGKPKPLTFRCGCVEGFLAEKKSNHLHSCGSCGKIETKKAEFKVCRLCMVDKVRARVFYCSVQCHLKDWSDHSRFHKAYQRLEPADKLRLFKKM